MSDSPTVSTDSKDTTHSTEDSSRCDDPCRPSAFFAEHGLSGSTVLREALNGIDIKDPHLAEAIRIYFEELAKHDTAPVLHQIDSTEARQVASDLARRNILVLAARRRLEVAQAALNRAHTDRRAARDQLTQNLECSSDDWILDPTQEAIVFNPSKALRNLALRLAIMGDSELSLIVEESGKTTAVEDDGLFLPSEMKERLGEIQKADPNLNAAKFLFDFAVVLDQMNPSTREVIASFSDDNYLDGALRAARDRSLPAPVQHFAKLCVTTHPEVSPV